MLGRCPLCLLLEPHDCLAGAPGEQHPAEQAPVAAARAVIPVRRRAG